jgi:cyclopropane fatty-acyl-phospholipid synthase-like methyltransferase
MKVATRTDETVDLALRQWVRRLETRHDDVLKFVDEPTYRVWMKMWNGRLIRCQASEPLAPQVIFNGVDHVKR